MWNTRHGAGIVHVCNCTVCLGFIVIVCTLHFTFSNNVVGSAVFLTGSDRIPILGMKSLVLVIQPTGGGENYLPVAHTCFNLLDLPKYTSQETLKEKLLQAIEHNQGFNLV